MLIFEIDYNINFTLQLMLQFANVADRQLEHIRLLHLAALPPGAVQQLD